jgi:hypothetical protein
MSTATTIEISSAFVNVMDISVAFTDKATNTTLLPNGNVYVPPSDSQTYIQYSSNLKSLSNLGTSGIVNRLPSGDFTTTSIGAGLMLGVSGSQAGGTLFVSPSIVTSSQQVENELLAGIDGVTTVFQTAQPHIVGTVKLYYNGLRADPSAHYSTDGTNVSLNFTPQVGDYLVVDYKWTQ